MAILVVEQYFEWARDIADDYAVMDRGAIVLSGTRAEMDETAVRGRMTVSRCLPLCDTRANSQLPSFVEQAMRIGGGRPDRWGWPSRSR